MAHCGFKVHTSLKKNLKDKRSSTLNYFQSFLELSLTTPIIEFKFRKLSKTSL